MKWSTVLYFMVIVPSDALLPVRPHLLITLSEQHHHLGTEYHVPVTVRCILFKLPQLCYLPRVQGEQETFRRPRCTLRGLGYRTDEDQAHMHLMVLSRSVSIVTGLEQTCLWDVVGQGCLLEQTQLLAVLGLSPQLLAPAPIPSLHHHGINHL